NKTSNNTNINGNGTINVSNNHNNHLTPPPANPRYSGLQKKSLINQRLHGRKFFDSADWALGNAMDDSNEQPLLNAGLIPSNKVH
ncbi:hypothetical protein DICPUDRAFT_14102, partial [Dictyostelium purpureum]